MITLTSDQSGIAGLNKRSDLHIGMVVPTLSTRAMGGGDTRFSLAIKTPQQLDILQQTGSTVYRMVASCSASGNLGDFTQWFIDTMAQTRARGLRTIILLIDRVQDVFTPNWDNDPKEDVTWTDAEMPGKLIEAYNLGYTLGSGFLTIHGNYINDDDDILELGNEPELFRKIQKAEPGSFASHFFPKKLELMVRYAKGMYEGAKSVRPNLKMSTPASQGWYPIYLYDRFIADAMPDVEFLSWHWYSDMENNINQNGWFDPAARNQFQSLYDRYGKDMIITETNAKGTLASDGPESSSKHQSRQMRHFKAVLKKANAVPAVKCITFYRQFSDPYQSYNEGSLGLEYFGDNFDTSLDRPDQDFQSALRPKGIIRSFTFTLADKMDPATEVVIRYASMQGYKKSTCIAALDLLIKGLRAAGIWSKLDLFYVFAAHQASDDFKLLNLKDPTQFKAVVNGTITSTPEGFEADGSGAHINTGFNGLANGVSYVLNNASRGAWAYKPSSNPTVTGPSSLDGVGNDTSNRMLLGNFQYQRINQGVSNLNAAVDLSGIGYRAINRTSASNVLLIKDDVAITRTATSTSVIPGIQLLFRSISTEKGNLGLSMYYMGAAFTLAQHNQFRDLFNAYRISIGLEAVDKARV